MQVSTSTVSNRGWVRWKLCQNTLTSGAAMKRNMRKREGPTKAAKVLNFIRSLLSRTARRPGGPEGPPEVDCYRTSPFSFAAVRYPASMSASAVAASFAPVRKSAMPLPRAECMMPICELAG